MMEILCVTCLLLQPQNISAQEIYRWVDETGRVHMSDKVPERFKSSAKRYDPRQFDQTEEQRRQAVINSNRAADVLNRPVPAATGPNATGPGASSVPENQPPLDPETADCDALHRQFMQAQECYTPYRTKNGIRGGEAYQACRDIPAPPSRCGLQKIYR